MGRKENGKEVLSERKKSVEKDNCLKKPFFFGKGARVRVFFFERKYTKIKIVSMGFGEVRGIINKGIK